MNYSKMLKADIANGEGWRVSIWLCGCGFHCEGCFNRDLWDSEFGNRFDDDAKSKIFNELAQPYCSGLSILGGEPLYTTNYKGTIKLCREVKEKFPQKTIWMWSGFKYEEILSDPKRSEVLKYVDVLVDGRFVLEQKDLSLPFRGSSNQRVISVQESLRKGTVVEFQQSARGLYCR